METGEILTRAESDFLTSSILRELAYKKYPQNIVRANSTYTLVYDADNPLVTLSKLLFDIYTNYIQGKSQVLSFLSRLNLLTRKTVNSSDGIKRYTIPFSEEPDGMNLLLDLESEHITLYYAMLCFHDLITPKLAFLKSPDTLPKLEMSEEGVLDCFLGLTSVESDVDLYYNKSEYQSEIKTDGIVSPIFFLMVSMYSLIQLYLNYLDSSMKASLKAIFVTKEFLLLKCHSTLLAWSLLKLKFFGQDEDIVLGSNIITGKDQELLSACETYKRMITFLMKQDTEKIDNSVPWKYLLIKPPHAISSASLSSNFGVDIKLQSIRSVFPKTRHRSEFMGLQNKTQQIFKKNYIKSFTVRILVLFINHMRKHAEIPLSFSEAMQHLSYKTGELRSYESLQKKTMAIIKKKEDEMYSRLSISSNTLLTSEINANKQAVTTIEKILELFYQSSFSKSDAKLCLQIGVQLVRHLINYFQKGLAKKDGKLVIKKHSDMLILMRRKDFFVTFLKDVIESLEFWLNNNMAAIKDLSKYFSEHHANFHSLCVISEVTTSLAKSVEQWKHSLNVIESRDPEEDFSSLELDMIFENIYSYELDIKLVYDTILLKSIDKAEEGYITINEALALIMDEKTEILFNGRKRSKTLLGNTIEKPLTMKSEEYKFAYKEDYEKSITVLPEILDKTSNIFPSRSEFVKIDYNVASKLFQLSKSNVPTTPDDQSDTAQLRSSIRRLTDKNHEGESIVIMIENDKKFFTYTVKRTHTPDPSSSSSSDPNKNESDDELNEPAGSDDESEEDESNSNPIQLSVSVFHQYNNNQGPYVSPLKIEDFASMVEFVVKDLLRSRKQTDIVEVTATENLGGNYMFKDEDHRNIYSQPHDKINRFIFAYWTAECILNGMDYDYLSNKDFINMFGGIDKWIFTKYRDSVQKLLLGK